MLQAEQRHQSEIDDGCAERAQRRAGVDGLWQPGIGDGREIAEEQDELGEEGECHQKCEICIGKSGKPCQSARRLGVFHRPILLTDYEGKSATPVIVPSTFFQ